MAGPVGLEPTIVRLTAGCIANYATAQRKDCCNPKSCCYQRYIRTIISSSLIKYRSGIYSITVIRLITFSRTL